MKQEVVDASAQLKASIRSCNVAAANYSDHRQTLDTRIAEIEPVVQRLELEHKQTDGELSQKIAEAQRVSQDLNVGVDKLEGYNKAIER